MLHYVLHEPLHVCFLQYNIKTGPASLIVRWLNRPTNYILRYTFTVYYRNCTCSLYDYPLDCVTDPRYRPGTVQRIRIINKNYATSIKYTAAFLVYLQDKTLQSSTKNV